MFFTEFLQVLPIVESGFSSAHVAAEAHADAAAPSAVAPVSAAPTMSNPAAQAPLARSLEDSPLILSHQADPPSSEGESWML